MMILRGDQRINVVVRALMFQGDHLLVTQWRDTKEALAYFLCQYLPQDLGPRVSRKPPLHL